MSGTTTTPVWVEAATLYLVPGTGTSPPDPSGVSSTFDVTAAQPEPVGTKVGPVEPFADNSAEYTGTITQIVGQLEPDGTIIPYVPPPPNAAAADLSTLKADAAHLAALPQTTNVKAVENGVTQLGDLITIATLNGVTSGTLGLVSTINSFNTLAADTAKFINSPTQTNTEAFAHQLGSTTGGIIGAVLAAPAAELASVAGGAGLAALVEGSGAVLGSILGDTIATGVIGAENAAFNAADRVVSAAGTFNAAIAAGDSPLMALNAGLMVLLLPHPPTAI